MQLGPDGRVQPVRPDEHVAPQRRAGAGKPVADPHLHPRPGLGKTGNRGTGAHGVRPEPGPHRGEQDHLQLAAVNGVLRPAVADVPAAGEAPDPVAVPVEVHHFRGGDSGRLELLAEAELGQFADRVRHQVDAHAERPQRSRRVDYGRVDPGGVQRQRRREPADTRPRDDHAHQCKPQTGETGQGADGGAKPPVALRGGQPGQGEGDGHGRPAGFPSGVTTCAARWPWFRSTASTGCRPQFSRDGAGCRVRPSTTRRCTSVAVPGHG